MQNDDVALPVRQLIHRHVRSMDHAEAVLFLAASPGEPRHLDAVAASHRWPSHLAAQVLDDLVESGMAAADDAGCYRLLPEAIDAEVLAGLSELYHRQPVTLARTIYSAPMPLRAHGRSARLDDDVSSSA